MRGFVDWIKKHWIALTGSILGFLVIGLYRLVDVFDFLRQHAPEVVGFWNSLPEWARSLIVSAVVAGLGLWLWLRLVKVLKIDRTDYAKIDGLIQQGIRNSALVSEMQATLAKLSSSVAELQREHFVTGIESKLTGHLESLPQHWDNFSKVAQGNNDLGKTVIATQLERHLNIIAAIMEEASGHRPNLFLHPRYDKDQQRPVPGDDVVPDNYRQNYRRWYDIIQTALVHIRQMTESLQQERIDLAKRIAAKGAERLQ